MTSRTHILNRVRAALEPIAERAAYPTYSPEIVTTALASATPDSWTTFKQSIARVNGLALDRTTDLVAWLHAHQHTHGYCDPELWPQLAHSFDDRIRIERVFERSRIDDYSFGITRAAGVIAETGSIILHDRSTSSRLAALTPWVHVAIVDRETIFPDLSSAIAALGTDPNVIWCTGPSKTADVEGILIEGVHGPGVQIALLA